MSNSDLRVYIKQMLLQLAELADAKTEDTELGAIAFDLRLLADRSAGDGPVGEDITGPKLH